MKIDTKDVNSPTAAIMDHIAACLIRPGNFSKVTPKAKNRLKNGFFVSMSSRNQILNHLDLKSPLYDED